MEGPPVAAALVLHPDVPPLRDTVHCPDLTHKLQQGERKFPSSSLFHIVITFSHYHIFSCFHIIITFSHLSFFHIIELQQGERISIITTFPHNQTTMGRENFHYHHFFTLSSLFHLFNIFSHFQHFFTFSHYQTTKGRVNSIIITFSPFQHFSHFQHFFTFPHYQTTMGRENFLYHHLFMPYSG